MTVMHVSNLKPTKDGQLQATSSSPSHEKKDTVQSEEVKEQFANIDTEDAVIKGNKDLGVEVKLSELIAFGGLGAGASGSVQKCVHKPTRKVIALKVIELQSN
jgi:hypothetical protein